MNKLLSAKEIIEQVKSGSMPKDEALLYAMQKHDFLIKKEKHFRAGLWKKALNELNKIKDIQAPIKKAVKPKTKTKQKLSHAAKRPTFKQFTQLCTKRTSGDYKDIVFYNDNKFVHCVEDDFNIVYTATDNSPILPSMNGAYNVHGLMAGMVRPDDNNLEMQPHEFNQDNIVFEHTVTHDALLFVSKAQSTELTRYYLNGIFFNDYEMIATDGHRLHVYDLDGAKHERGSGQIVQRLAIDAALKLSLKQDVSVMFDDGGMFKIVGAGFYIVGKCIDSTYPDYGRVIPAPDNDKSFPLSFDDLPTLAQCKLEQKAQGLPAPCVNVETPNGEQRFNAVYLLSDGIEGQAQQSGDKESMRVDSDKKTMVLMPLRK